MLTGQHGDVVVSHQAQGERQVFMPKNVDAFSGELRSRGIGGAVKMSATNVQRRLQATQRPREPVATPVMQSIFEPRVRHPCVSSLLLPNHLFRRVILPESPEFLPHLLG